MALIKSGKSLYLITLLLFIMEKKMVVYDFKYTEDICTDYTILGTTIGDNGIKKIAIFCRKCYKNPNIKNNGIFYITKGNLKARQKPCYCGNKPLTLEEKYEKLSRFNSDLYTLISIVDGKRGGTVTYECKIHGMKQATYCNYLKGRRCRDCSNTKTSTRCKTEEIGVRENLNKNLNKNINFIKFAGDYKGNTTNVILECKEHGIFERSLRVISAGCTSCPLCNKNIIQGSNYKLYILLLKGFGDIFLKIGITRKLAEERATTIERSSIFDVNIIYCVDINDLLSARRIEKYIKNKYNRYYVTKECMPDGFTETLSLMDYHSIMSDINNMLLACGAQYKIIKDISLTNFNIVPELGGWNDM